jgi:site-specific DNA recombinase
MVVDGLDRRMSPSHANKGSKRYRYYITHEAGVDAANPAWRVSAHDLERIVVDRLRAFLNDGTAVHAAIANPANDTREFGAIIAAAADAAAELGKCVSRERAALISHYIARVSLRAHNVEIAVRRASLLLDGADPIDNDDTIILRTATARVRRGHEIRLIIPSVPSSPTIQRDERLVELIADAHAARALLVASPDRSIDQIASAHGRCRTNLARLIKLSYLAPDIVTMILQGRQPARLDRRALMAAGLPLGWAEQRALLGCI